MIIRHLQGWGAIVRSPPEMQLTQLPGRGEACICGCVQNLRELPGSTVMWLAAGRRRGREKRQAETRKGNDL